MSHLRAPAARSDRREGGRHGRSAHRPQPSAAPAGTPAPSGRPPGGQRPAAESRIRPQLLRTAVLPTVVAVLCGITAVVFTLHSTGAHPSRLLWAALAGVAVLACASVAAAAVGADRTAKTVLGRANGLRRDSARSAADLRTVVEGLRRGEGPPARHPLAQLPTGADEFALLSHELTRSHEAAVAAVVQASQLSSSVGNEQKVEVFVNLARRLQSLVHREIQLLDELENEVEDPELLKGLFHVDHLATRIRRHAENLAVLGGAISRRQWSHPVTMTEVLRSSIAEVEQYPRVKLVPPIDGTLRGHAVADVIHLLAELVENATLFSAPHTQVLLRAQLVTAGLAVEVEDRGLGMPVTEQNKMNALLSDPDQVNVAHLLQDGRIGLFVVSALARRHGIAVRLQTNIYGGVQAVLVLPQGLLGASTESAKDGQSDERAAVAEPARAPLPAAGQTPSAAPAAAPAPPPSAAPAAPPAPVHRTPAHGTALPPLPRQPREGDTVSVNGTAPLPVRAAHEERPTPAAAPPGLHLGPGGAAPAPIPAMNGTVRAAAGRPDLPRRRSQEHLVPQLRDAPAARKEDEHALHDPGLMAAFQRGIGLAESQPAPHDLPAAPQPHPPHPARPLHHPRMETDVEHSKE
ncbi:sensor histidine kinase [Streptomyces sp. NPDC059070]|uniref:sensor histidine kinase n=1 Tax=unclassified Streptomyces TaxID=2593676 RepID=UPI0034E22D30